MYKKKYKKHFLNISSKNQSGNRLPIADWVISCGCVLQKLLGTERLLQQNVLPAVHNTRCSLSSSVPEYLIKANSNPTLAYLHIKQTPVCSFVICPYQSLRSQGGMHINEWGFSPFLSLQRTIEFPAKILGQAQSSSGTPLQHTHIFQYDSKNVNVSLVLGFFSFVRVLHTFEIWHGGVYNIWSVGKRCRYHQGGVKKKKPTKKPSRIINRGRKNIHHNFKILEQLK